MAGPHAATRAILLTVAMLVAGHRLPADSIVLPVPESPATIFSARLGSVDVDLTAVGSWAATLSVGGYLLFSPGVPMKAGIDDSSPVPNLPLLRNIPDITVSLELLKHFFLSASIIGSFANNYIQAGYRGGPGDALRSVIIGTQGITIPASLLMQIPEQPQGSLGMMSELAAAGSTNDFLLRWDATLPKTKTFIGRNELVEQEIGINEYIRGMYFYLPDTDLDTGTLQVFIEDPNGTYVSADGRKYRLATYTDVVLDSVDGLVSLKSAVKGRVLAYYRKGGLGVGFTTGATFVDVSGTPPTRNLTPAPFSWSVPDHFVPAPYPNMDPARKVTLPGIGDTLLLWEPGDNSPFEIDSSYAFSSHPPSDVSRISIKLNPRDSTPLPTAAYIFQSDPPNNRFSVLLSQAYRSYSNFYPFYTDANAALIYGPQRDSISGGLDYDLFVQMTTPVSTFTLEANIEPGSVQVTVNGMPETRFEVEPVSGTLTPHFDILPTDRIEVNYRKAEAGISGGDILFAWRSAIPLSDTTNVSLSAGVRWNANPWTWSQEPYSKSGTVIATAGIDHKTDTFQYSAQAGVSYTNPDTTGILRLFGMEGNATQLDLSEDSWYPASAPGSEFAPALTQAARGILHYRDYRNYDKNLGVLSLDTIAATPHPQMAYASGNRVGPYNVTGSDGNLSATSLVFEYALGTGQWVGAQVPVAAGSDVDLSSARAITVRYRSGTGPQPQSGTVTMYLQVGSTSEDLDGTGALKAESSAADSGFAFLDQSNGNITLKVGAGPRLTGNAKLDSEDTNGNTILDLEDPTRVVKITGITIASTASSSWQTPFTYLLTDADRQMLLRARGVRIVIVESGGSTASGDILIDSVTIEGTPFWTQTGLPTDRTNVHVQEVAETFAQQPPSGGDFASRFGATYGKFHPNNEQNQVLETTWGPTVSASFTVQGFVAQGTGGIQYQTVVSYIRADSAGGTYQFSLLDSSSRGVVWNVSVSDNAWHEVKVSRKDAAVTVDGVPTGGGFVRFDSNYASLTQFKVAVTGIAFPTTGAGHLYLDEIHLTDPQSVLGAAFVGSLSAKFPGTVLAAGKTPILSNVALSQDVALYSGGFAALYGTPYAAEDLSSRSHLDADLLFVRASLDLALRDQDGSLTASGGHRLTVPATGSPLTVTDAYSLSTAGGFTREDLLSLSLGRAASLTLDASASASPDETDTSGLLTQSWVSGLTLSPFAPFGISSSLSLSQALTGYTLGREWYGARWAKDGGLLLPWEGGGDVSRSEKLDLTAGIPAAPFGFTLNAQVSAGGSAYTTAGYSQLSALALGLSFLLKLGPGDSADSIGLSYRRSLNVTTAPAAGPRFQQETSELGRILYLQGYLLQGIPLAEIFSDNTAAVLPAWQSATQGSYSPVVTLSMQRSYGSRLTDLFIPSTIDLAVGQELDKTSDLVQTVTYVRPKISTRAVNLFGQLGSVPRLRMVQTDEYSFSVSASVDRTTPAPYPQYGPGPLLSQLSVQAYAALVGADSSQLTLVETLRRDQAASVVLSNDAQALLEWRVIPPAGIPLPLLPPDIGATGRFEHRESAEVTVGYQDSGTFHPFTLLLGHSTSLVYPGHGSIKASLDFGMDVEDLLAVGLAWRFALRASIEAKLTF